MKRIILAIIFLASFQIATGQVSNEHLDAYLWEYPLQQNLVIDPELMQEMVAEIQRIIDSGDLFFRPLPNDFADQIYDHYFLYIEPGRILKTIAMAFPYLDTGMQETLRTMVQGLFADPVHRPWAAGPLPLDAGKERKPFAPETLWGEGSNFGLYRPTIQNVYNIWLYVYRTGHIEAITPAYYSQISGFYNNKLGSSDRGRLYGSMKAHIGMARLAHLFEDDDLYETARNALQSALNFGLNVNDVDTLASRGHSNAYWDGAYRYLYEWHPANPPWPNMRNWDWVNRNYIFHNISPEIGRYLQDYLFGETEARHDYMMNRFPMWWLREAPYFNRWTGDEGIGIPSSSFGTNVPLERWFSNADAETLASYMISSPVGVADSYWIEALIMAIEANATDQWVDVRTTAFELDLSEDDPPPVEYLLTLEIIGQGHVEVNGIVYTDQMLVEEGTVVTLEAYPVAGWQFDGWSGDLSGLTNPQTIVMDGNKDVTATFSEIPPVEYFLTIDIIGEGLVTVDGTIYTEPLPIEEGTVVTLDAIPDAGWQFDSWSGDLSGMTNPQTIVMDGNKDVTATFSEIPPVEYFLTIDIIGEGLVTVDGTIYTDPLPVEEGTELTLEAMPDADWQFDGWSGDLSGMTNPQTIVMDSNKDVTAIFSEIPPMEYFLTIDIIGQGHVEVDGTVYNNPLLVEEGTVLTLEAYPVAGWQFDSWSGDLAGAESTQTIVMDGNKDVTATFSEIPPVEYFLTIDIIGEGHVTVDGLVYTDPLSIEEGTVVTLEAYPVEGWQFDDWSGDLSGAASPQTIVMDSNKDVTATFSEIPPVEYFLTIDIIGEGLVTVDGTIYTEPLPIEEGTVVTLDAIPDAGWQFDGWSGDLSGTTNPQAIVMDGKKDVTATFSEIPPVEYFLTIEIIGQGHVLVDGAAYNDPLLVEEGTELTLEAFPVAGWQFDSWSGDLSGITNPQTIVMDGNKDVTATFSEIPPVEYFLTIEIIGQGHVEVDGVVYADPLLLEEGTELTLEAYPVAGWQFDGWSGDLSGMTNPHTIVMDGNKDITATFSEIPPVEFFLTIDIIGEGHVTVDGAVYTEPLPIEEGTVVTLEAVPDAGWQFDSWSGDLSGVTNPQTIVMDGNKDVTATFSEIPPVEYFLSVEIIGEGHVAVDGMVYAEPLPIEEGTVVTLEAIPDADWQFDGWSGDLSGMTNPQTIVMDGHQDVTATFSEIPPVEYFLTIDIIGQGHVEVDGAVYADPLLVEEGTELNLDAYPVAGWQFDGWSGDLSGMTSPQTIAIDGNKDVTATFSEIPPVEFFLTLEIIGQGHVTVDGTVYTVPLLIEEGTLVTLEAMPVAGWQFDGWSGDLSGMTNPQTIVMDGNKDVTATFSEIPPVEYFLTIDIFGEGHVTVDGTVYTVPLLIEEGTLVTLEAMPVAGWQFDGWSGDLSGMTNPQTIVMDGNKDITATFSEIPPVEYFLTIEIIGQGHVEVDGVVYSDPLLIEEGTVVTLEAYPLAGWQFDGWSGDLSGMTNPQTIVMDGNKDVTATFSEIPPVDYFLTIDIIGEGLVTVDGTIYTEPLPIEEGTVVTLDAIPDAGWQFDSWSGDLSGAASPQTIVMDGKKDVTATFSEIPPVEYFLTIDIIGEGLVTVNGSVYAEPLLIEEGTVVTLDALPDADWQFDGWSGDLSGPLSPQTILMDSNKDVTAIFSEIPPVEFFLTLDIIGQGHVEVNGVVYSDPLLVEEGTELTLEAFPDENRQFMKWLYGNQTIWIEPELLLAMPDHDIEIAAFFVDANIPQHLDINNETIADGQTACFSAMISLMVSDLLVEAGGAITLVAAKRIQITPGSHIQNGAALHAYITQSDEFCPEQMIAASGETEKTSSPVYVSDRKANDVSFKIYPNPSTGLVTLEFDHAGRNEDIQVEVFSVSGGSVYTETIGTAGMHMIDLEGRQPGIYMVRLIIGDGVGYARLVLR